MTAILDPVAESEYTDKVGTRGALEITEVSGKKRLVFYDGANKGGTVFEEGLAGLVESSSTSADPLSDEAAALTLAYTGPTPSNVYAGMIRHQQSLPGPTRTVAVLGPYLRNTSNANIEYGLWTRDDSGSTDPELRWRVLSDGNFRFEDIQVQYGTTSTYIEVVGTDMRAVVENARSFTISSANVDVVQATTLGEFKVFTDRLFVFGNSTIQMRQKSGDSLTLQTAASNSRTLEFLTLNSLRFKVSSTGHVMTVGIPTYADNTAAASLSSDVLYKTATGEVRVKY